MRSIFLLLFLVAACSQEMPPYYEVRDLRVLSISANPPTFLYDQPSAEVSFRALVVDPAGLDVDYTWSFCPVESSSACADFDLKLARVQEPTATALASARAYELGGTAVAPADAATGPLPRYEIVDFTIPAELLLSLTDYYLQNQFFGFGVGLWPQAILHASRPEEEIVAFKRFVVGLAELSAYNDLVGPALGYTFCPPEAAGDGCVAWDSTLAGNENPEFTSIQYSEGKSALASWRDLPEGEPLALRAGASVRLLPSFTPESFQSYQVLRSDLQGGVIRAEIAQEELSVSWFCSAGAFSDELTWPKFTRSLDTVYTAPKDLTGLVTIWMVAKDQRGGESFAHVTLRVEP